MSHPSQNPSGEQFTGYGYGSQPIDPRTGWPYPPHAAGRPSRKSPGLGIASLVLGIVGIMLAWIPLIGYFALIIGMVGAVLGFVGIFKSHRALSIAGTALSLSAMAFSIVAFVSLADALDDAANDYNAAVAEVPSAPTLAEPSADEAEGEGYPAPGHEAASDGDVMADNGWKLEKVVLSDPQLGIMTGRVTNNGPEARISFVEVSVLLDGEFVGSASGATDWTDVGETDTVQLFSVDLDIDPTTDPSRITYELTAQ